MERTTMKVPCNGCTLCCHRDLIPLMPEFGDDPAQYETEIIAGQLVLKRAANGDCFYLDRAKGCTIYERRPTTCREFDCAAAYRITGAAGRAKAIANGVASAAVFERGRQLLRNGYRPEALALRRRILGERSRKP